MLTETTMPGLFTDATPPDDDEPTEHVPQCPPASACADCWATCPVCGDADCANDRCAETLRAMDRADEAGDRAYDEERDAEPDIGW